MYLCIIWLQSSLPQDRLHVHVVLRMMQRSGDCTNMKQIQVMRDDKKATDIVTDYIVLLIYYV